MAALLEQLAGALLVEAADLAQAQLAAQAGISTPYLSQIESGKRRGTAEVLTKIAKALQVTLDDIVESR
jgi:transcriptional regulator with XRE-family HTH domain